MLPPPMHRCCRCYHHAAAAFLNALLLPLKLRFCQAATSAAKLATATMLLLLPPQPMHVLGLFANLKQHARLSKACLVEATSDNNLSVERNSMSN